MGREYLFVIGIPLQGAHLWVSLYWVHHLAGLGIPEFDALVSWASSWGEQVLLPGTPGDGLNGSLVVEHLVSGTIGGGGSKESPVHLGGLIASHSIVDIPNAQHVVVATTG